MFKRSIHKRDSGINVSQGMKMYLFTKPNH